MSEINTEQPTPYKYNDSSYKGMKAYILPGFNSENFVVKNTPKIIATDTTGEAVFAALSEMTREALSYMGNWNNWCISLPHFNLEDPDRRIEYDITMALERCFLEGFDFRNTTFIRDFFGLESLCYHLKLTTMTERSLERMCADANELKAEHLKRYIFEMHSSCRIRVNNNVIFLLNKTREEIFNEIAELRNESGESIKDAYEKHLPASSATLWLQ